MTSPLTTPVDATSDQTYAAVQRLRGYLETEIIGQQGLIGRLLMALLGGGHVLVEGAPGLAKTRAVKTLANGMEADFHRIQFTPDLVPADLTGSDVFRPEDGSFHFQRGPIFHNLLLADEINRAPAKVQSALLEAMGEGQVTVGAHSYPLPPLFLVMATQNPIEQEGTYPLPEAQLDRFMFHVQVDYPSRQAGREILRLVRREALAEASALTEVEPLSQQAVFAARRQVLRLHLSESVEEYLIELVEASRAPAAYSRELADWVRWGASPRGAIYLELAARAHAWLSARDFVTPEDVQAVAADVLRHRVLLNYEAQAEGVSAQRFVTELLSRVPAP